MILARTMVSGLSFIMSGAIGVSADCGVAGIAYHSQKFVTYKGASSACDCEDKCCKSGLQGASGYTIGGTACWCQMDAQPTQSANVGTVSNKCYGATFAEQDQNGDHKNSSQISDSVETGLNVDVGRSKLSPGQGCFILAKDRCCDFIDGRTDADDVLDQPCLPAKSKFPSGNECEPAGVVYNHGWQGDKATCTGETAPNVDGDVALMASAATKSFDYGTVNIVCNEWYGTMTGGGHTQSQCLAFCQADARCFFATYFADSGYCHIAVTCSKTAQTGYHPITYHKTGLSEALV